MNNGDYSDKDDTFTARIIKACYEAHNALGPGFNEKIYENALNYCSQRCP
ncbi:MAG TPA: hypothetical protein DER10_10710 [Elusimicrobia bacterium]|nr:hypothetical protein [Elusimicrobiota bacterium]HCE98952.1 hypothetical protein [Elusimicrobiota bacterium]